LGCGPGHVARYLYDRGVDALGIDLSEGMVAEAARRSPGIEFRQGDMRSLELADGSLTGIAAFYSIIHLPRADLLAVLRELRRVLEPGGLLLLAGHLGEGGVHRDEWFGRPVSLDATFYEREEIEGALAAAGFALERFVERDPYADVEYPSRRGYALASNAGGA
jgi:SAM-dependent methyltransferase